MKTLLRLTPIILFLILSGCATVSENQNQSIQFRAQGDYQGAARIYLTKNQKPNYNVNNLHQTLEAAKAFHDAGLWEFSNEAFARAHELMPWKEDTVDTPQEVVDLMGTTLTSSAFGPYQGKIFEGGLIDYYRALNYLMLKNDNARVSFRRLQERQKNAVVQLGSFARTSASQSAEVANHQEAQGASIDVEKIQDDLTRGIGKVRPGIMVSEIRNSAGDVMSALFRATSADPLDNDESLVQPMLAAAGESVASDEGKSLIANLKQYLATSQGSIRNAVIVLYEDGSGPGFEEYRLNLPMYLVSSKILYSAIALPAFREGQNASGYLRVGEAGDKTTLLTDLNRIAGLEFQKSYDGIVTKAVISTLIKTLAQHAANQEIDRQVNKQKIDPLAGMLMQIGTAATQAATTQADTRSWRNLPNSIQIAIIDRPTSGTLPLFTASRELVGSVDVTQAGNYLVLVRSASPQAKPVFYVTKL